MKSRVIRVDSTHLKTVVYNIEPYDETLYVEFQDGSIYKYTGISYQRITQLVNQPDSIGEYFHKHIRTNYPYERVT